MAKNINQTKNKRTIMNANFACEKVQEIKKFYRSLIWFFVVSAFIIIKNFVKIIELEQPRYIGLSIIAIWAILLSVRAVKLFVFNLEWENKIYEEELKKSKKGNYF